jgi:fermentation-respiration switch protein FrsA (DUF1100 family)
MNLPLAVRVAIGLLLAATIGLVGMVGAVLVVGLSLAAPAPRAVGAPPELPGLAPVEIASGSGSTLHGWLVPGAPGGGAVVLMHGVWSDRRSMIERARWLHDQGFAVLLFDLQAHGESPGRHISFGHLEGMDAQAAVAFVRQQLPGERVGVIGVSLGGAAALLGPQPLPVEALVLESVFPDINAALSNRLRAALGPVLGSLFTPLLTPLFQQLLPPILGVRLEDLRPVDRIGGVTAPVLVASGTVDDRTPIGEARQLFDRAPEPKLFWPVEGAAHVDLESYAPEDYRRIVLPFLTRYLRQHGR